MTFQLPMRILSIGLFLSASALINSATAQSTPDSAPLSRLRIEKPSPNQLQWIGDRYEITAKNANSYDVVLPASEVPAVQSKGLRSQLIEADLTGNVKAQLKRFEISSRQQSFRSPLIEVRDALTQNLDVFRVEAKAGPTPRYRKLSEVYDWMKGVAKASPQLVKLSQYGTSGRGNPLIMLSIGRGQESQVMLTAATHGDELITVEVLLALTERLIAGDGVSARLTSILNSRLIHIIPVVNPDGFAGQNRYEGNADPNRSYPAPNKEKNRPTPSIAALIQFFQNNPIQASIDFHAYGSLVMYPWAYTDEAIEDTAAGRAADFRNLAGQMAAQNSYEFGQISKILYPAPGSSCDFYFWKKQSRSFGIELGSSKVPNPSEIPSYVDSQVESTWVFLESI